MPGRRYLEISRKLKAAGLASDTPCAVISQATTAREQVHATDLENLHNSPNLPAPTLLVIGEVARRARRDAMQPLTWEAMVPGQEFTAISAVGNQEQRS